MNPFLRENITATVEQMYPVKTGLLDMFWGDKEGRAKRYKRGKNRDYKGQ